MNLEEQPAAKTETKAVVGGKERKVAKVERKTKEGKVKQKESQEARVKEDQLIKATLKQKQGEDAGDSDGWESVEEDFPHIKLDELKNLEEQLANMKIQKDDEDEEEAEDGDMGDEEEKEVIG